VLIDVLDRGVAKKQPRASARGEGYFTMGICRTGAGGDSCPACPTLHVGASPMHRYIVGANPRATIGIAAAGLLVRALDALTLPAAPLSPHEHVKLRAGQYLAALQRGPQPG